MNLDNTQTLKNLARAYMTETHDGAIYQFMRTEASKQKLHFLAETFKTLATNEMAHAKVWWDFITNSGKTSYPNLEIKAGFPFVTGTLLEQVQAAYETETLEGDNLYLSFARKAESENFPEIAKAFELAAEVERTHAALLKQVHEKLQNNQMYTSDTPKVWKCTKCGHIDTGKKSWKTCPLCQEPQGYTEGNINAL